MTFLTSGNRIILKMESQLTFLRVDGSQKKLLGSHFLGVENGGFHYHMVMKIYFFNQNLKKLTW